MTQCDPKKKRAEAIAQRLGLDQNKQAPVQHISDPKAVVDEKTWTMTEVLEYMSYEDCFTQCQKPIHMLQMMIKQNVMAIGRNQ